jgi:LPXTG-motif cell wall-anchored protein
MKPQLIKLSLFSLIMCCISIPVYAVPTISGVPDPVSMLSLLGVGLAGVSGYLFIRKRKDE